MALQVCGDEALFAAGRDCRHTKQLINFSSQTRNHEMKEKKRRDEQTFQLSELWRIGYIEARDTPRVDKTVPYPANQEHTSPPT